MPDAALRETVELARRTGQVYLATADAAGAPHLASAGELRLDGADRVALAEWFCPATVENVRRNPQVAVVAWDAEADRGFQLLGTVLEVRELAMLDGYAPEAESGPPRPQVERELLVRVTQVLAFSRAHHSDLAL